MEILYVAQKKRPRGRFRRNLEFCLSHGHNVTVLLPSLAKSHFDLDHPNLKCVYMDDNLKLFTARKRKPFRFDVLTNLWKFPIALVLYLISQLFSRRSRLSLWPNDISLTVLFRNASRSRFLRKIVRRLKFLQKITRTASTIFFIYEVKSWVSKSVVKSIFLIRSFSKKLKRYFQQITRTASTIFFIYEVKSWVSKSVVKSIFLIRSFSKKLKRYFQQNFKGLNKTVWSKVKAAPAAARLIRNIVFWKDTRDYIISNPNFDLLWSQDFPGLVGTSVAAYRLKLRHFHDCSEFYAYSTGIGSAERFLTQLIERRCLRRCTKIIVVNNSIQERLLKKHAIESRVIRNCTSYSNISTLQGNDPRNSLFTESDKKTIIYCGGFQKGRGLEVLANASWNLPDKWRIVFIGSGNQEENLKAICAGNSKAIFMNEVPPEQLLSILSQADVGVIPYEGTSLNNKLALPNKVFEYTAAGLAIIGTKLPEVTSILEEGIGVSYDEGDEKSFLQSLSELSDSALKHMQLNARNWYENNSWDVESKKLKDYFDDVSINLK